MNGTVVFHSAGVSPLTEPERQHSADVPGRLFCRLSWCLVVRLLDSRVNFVASFDAECILRSAQLKRLLVVLSPRMQDSAKREVRKKATLVVVDIG